MDLPESDSLAIVASPSHPSAGRYIGYAPHEDEGVYMESVGAGSLADLFVSAQPLTLPTTDDTLRVRVHGIFCPNRSAHVAADGLVLSFVLDWGGRTMTVHDRVFDVIRINDDLTVERAESLRSEPVQLIAPSGEVERAVVLAECTSACTLEFISVAEAMARASAGDEARREAAERHARELSDARAEESDARARKAAEDYAAQTERIKKWSADIQKLIRARQIRIGMNQEMVVESWGRPTRVNATITRDGREEQWVYKLRGGRLDFVYFSVGIVTGIQTSR